MPGLCFIAGSLSVGFKPRDLLLEEWDFAPVVIIPIRNCYTHTFAHLKTWVKNSSGSTFFFFFFLCLSNSVAGAELAQSEQISTSWFLGWHRLLLNSRSIMSAKKMWSYFILNKSSFEQGKFELSANTIMNPDFRVHFWDNCFWNVAMHIHGCCRTRDSTSGVF